MAVAEHFSKNLFWEIDESSLDQEIHARFIIDRVLSRGKISDWEMLLQMYGSERIRQESLKIRFLDRITLSFLSSIFNTPKSKFRCYKQQRSIQEPWPY